MKDGIDVLNLLYSQKDLYKNIINTNGWMLKHTLFKIYILDSKDDNSIIKQWADKFYKSSSFIKIIKNFKIFMEYNIYILTILNPKWTLCNFCSNKELFCYTCFDCDYEKIQLTPNKDIKLSCEWCYSYDNSECPDCHNSIKDNKEEYKCVSVYGSCISCLKIRNKHLPGNCYLFKTKGSCLTPGIGNKIFNIRRYQIGDK